MAPESHRVGGETSLPSSVLVTGAAGFVGRRLVTALLAGGCEVVAVARHPPEAATPPAVGDTSPGLRWVAADLREGLRWSELAGTRALVNLAAVRDLPGASPAAMEQTNVAATLALFEAAAEGGVGTAVQVSTTRVFGPVEAGAPPCDEESPLCRDRRWGAYAETRARATSGLRALRQRGAAVSILHAPILFGPDGPGYENRVTAALRRVLRRRAAVVVAGGRAPRDLLHVDDLVTAILAALRSPATGLEAIVGGEPIAHAALLASACALAGGRPPAILSVPVRLARGMAVLADRWSHHDPGAGMEIAVDNLTREWRAVSRCAHDALGHRPPLLGRRLGEVVEWLGRSNG